MTRSLLGSILLLACAEVAQADVPAPAVDLPAEGGIQTAVFAGGCFWCVEAVFEAVEGVTEVVSGYAGDTAESARYDRVSAGETKHAEVVEVRYDASRVSYGQLLHILFVTSDPTLKDRQGPDVGHQYRMAIFVRGEGQRKVAEQYLAQLTAAKVYPSPIQTTIEPLTAFYPAEAFHQDYVRLNPNHPYVRTWSAPKLAKLAKRFPDRLKKRPR